MMNWLVKAVAFSAILLAATAWAREADKTDLYDRSHVGPLSDGRIIVPTNQILSPAGRQVVVGGRPTDVALAPNGRWPAVQSSARSSSSTFNRVRSHMAAKSIAPS